MYQYIRLDWAVCKFKKKDCWLDRVWETTKTFHRLKVIVAKKPVVNILDPKKGIMLTNAREHSISGKLSPEVHPIIYLSNGLTNTEFNYSNIEKKALAIV